MRSSMFGDERVWRRRNSVGRQLEGKMIRMYSVVGEAFLERNNELGLDGEEDRPLELSYEALEL